MNAKQDKTVFFLGAGFSYPSGVPIQQKLLREVLEDLSQFNDKPENYSNFHHFLRDAFKRTDNIDISLEDFYTPIDRSIADSISFRGYSTEFLQSVKNFMSSRITNYIKKKSKVRDAGYIDNFIDVLIAKHQKFRTKDDLALITSNWDTLIDDKLFQKMKAQKELSIDFGLWAVSLDENQKNQLIPPQTARSNKIKPFKFFKIHGSINWHTCPSCNRVFVDNSGVLKPQFESNSIQCRFCSNIFSKLEQDNFRGIKLNPFMIYPTYLKDIKNLQFKMLWENFGTELSEASHLIFIGYSLPAADYEIRLALLRKVPDDCKVTVVTFEDDQSKSSDLKMKDNVIEKTYRGLFGDREIKFYKSGVEAFVTEELQSVLG